MISFQQVIVWMVVVTVLTLSGLQIAKSNTEAMHLEQRVQTLELKVSALEEVLHILLTNLWHYAESRDFNEEVYRAEEHSIIHKLQKVLT